MSGLMSRISPLYMITAGASSSPSPAAPKPKPRPADKADEERAAAARRRRLSARPLISGSPLGVQTDVAGGLQTTFGPS